ncbi:MAG: nucleotide-binding protein [Acidobacteriota bacterium]|nr:nucleotide-binding protein [Acidobacteriota bacterium]
MRVVVIMALAIVALGCTADATEPRPATQSAGFERIAGTVLETHDASNYTYVRFRTADGEAWAAVPQARLEVGAQVVIANPQAMPNFESESLGRSFETIYFGTLENSPAVSPKAPTGNAPIAIDKPVGKTARTIAELYADSGELSGKVVTLRGQVVKFSSGIMGRNWIHLQDGSGDETAGTHDITVTTSDATAVGEIVSVQGTVAVDKNFGAGYRYAVIVEEATVK